MTKKDLMEKLDELLKQKGMCKVVLPNGTINWNSNKATIEGAIKCLEASDEEMQDYLTVIKLKYPNTYKVIVDNGDWLTHAHNRFYVYNTAKLALSLTNMM